MRSVRKPRALILALGSGGAGLGRPGTPTNVATLFQCDPYGTPYAYLGHARTIRPVIRCESNS